jgi:hypothetical protein
MGIKAKTVFAEFPVFDCAVTQSISKVGHRGRNARSHPE